MNYNFKRPSKILEEECQLLGIKARLVNPACPFTIGDTAVGTMIIFASAEDMSVYKLLGYFSKAKFITFMSDEEFNNLKLSKLEKYFETD